MKAIYIKLYTKTYIHTHTHTHTQTYRWIFEALNKETKKFKNPFDAGGGLGF